MMEEALAICRQNFKSPIFQGRKVIVHIMYAQMLSNYGLILRDAENLSKAHEVLLEALNLQDSLLARESLARIKTINRLGTVLHRQKQHDQARRRMETSLALLKAVNSEHPYNATISTGIARLMLDMGDTSLARSHIGESLKIRTDTTRCSGEIHTQVARCYRILGDISLSCENPDFKAAHHYYMKSLIVFARLVEREMAQRSLVSVKLGKITFVENWEKRMSEIEQKLQNIVDKLSL